jgi:Mn2+/Fe2+ NRAMP family transporter
MVLTAASLPFTVVPLLAIMNDQDVMLTNANGWCSNVALVVLSVLSIALCVAAVPLQIKGGG